MYMLSVIAATSEKAEKLKAGLIKARDNTGVGLTNSSTIKVFKKERNLTILKKEMIGIIGRMEVWETKRNPTQINSRM